MKVRNLVHHRTLPRKRKNHPQNGENICKYISDQGLTSRIYKITPTTQWQEKQINQLICGQGTLPSFFSGENTLLQRRHTNDQYAHVRMLNMSHQGNVIPWGSHPLGWFLFLKRKISVENVQKSGALRVAGGDVKRCGCHGTALQCPKRSDTASPCGLAISRPGTDPQELRAEA